MTVIMAAVRSGGRVRGGGKRGWG
ncbi:hypothetical protein Goshw_029944 [Gossypium schwendimanii]|uniref:Uncharacterized protein n=1 Tax=Gossypium schwendimanii TaxID=34291 RepID=A0A7J9LCT3_GOSSC|nr:hypothetical protein [Gossypium schwendimanii]